MTDLNPESVRIGNESAGDFARRQLEAARKDPRLSRENGHAVLADFRDAMDEAERVRALSEWGLHELAFALEREEQRQGVRHDAAHIPPSAARALQAAWERAELARAEIENETPHFNAQALISMNSALDAMVEELVVSWRSMTVKTLARQMVMEVTRKVEVKPEDLDSLSQVFEDFVDDRAPKSLRPKGYGVARYERPLARIGWQADKDRPIPNDLGIALTELGALRDVLVHRAGRVDEKALDQVPTLQYKVGQFVRISRADYRTYSAAIRCYGHEISFRPMRSWPEVVDADLPDLAGWRGYAAVNV